MQPVHCFGSLNLSTGFSLPARFATSPAFHNQSPCFFGVRHWFWLVESLQVLDCINGNWFVFFVNLLSQFFLHKSIGPFFVFKKGMWLGPFGVPGRKSSVMFSRQSLRRHLFLWDSVDCELLWVMYSGGWWNLGISWIDLLLRFT